MKVRDMIRLIEQDGWTLRRIAGSHRQYVHPVKPGKVTIRGHPHADFASQDRSEHPSTSGTEPMTDYRKLAETYLILVEGGPPSNFSAWSPDLLGCAGAGATVEACVEDMLDAIAAHLEAMAADGEQLPTGTGPGVYVERPQTAA